MSTERYEIRAVADFLQVPEDRREVCIQEFLVWLRIIEAINDQGANEAMTDRYVWLDDGAGLMHIMHEGRHVEDIDIDGGLT